MGCNCGKSKSGTTIIYQLHLPGQAPKVYSSKADAGIANARAGGNGTIISTTQAAK